MVAEAEETSPKQKFVFNCKKDCGVCCENRGPIPLVMDDLIMWSRNNVLANFMPYLKFFRTPKGTIDLVLSRSGEDPYAFIKPEADSDEKKEEEPKDISCPLYNKETKLCLVYENRPMSCRTYPLEYDGSSFQVIDADDCPGIGFGENTKEEREAMRDTAKLMNTKLTEMRISMPVIAQAMQPFVLQEIMMAQKQYMDAMEKMSPEERQKVEEQMAKQMDKSDAPKVDVEDATK